MHLCILKLQVHGTQEILTMYAVACVRICCVKHLTSDDDAYYAMCRQVSFCASRRQGRMKKCQQAEHYSRSCLLVASVSPSVSAMTLSDGQSRRAAPVV